MHTFISMLRGINLGSHNKIGMPVLKDLYESLHFTNVVTYVQSGNVIFDCEEEQDTIEIARSIETAITHLLGFSVPVLIRDKKLFRQLIERNPFVREKHADPASLYVTFLYHLPDEVALSKLTAPAGISDEFSVADGEIYLFCPGGYGNTKLSNSFFERKLGTSATTRNWNTVNALYSLANQR